MEVVCFIFASSAIAHQRIMKPAAKLIQVADVHACKPVSRTSTSWANSFCMLLMPWLNHASRFIKIAGPRICTSCDIQEKHACVQCLAQDKYVTCTRFRMANMMRSSHLLIQPLHLHRSKYKDLSLELVPINLTIRYFHFLELSLTYMRI
jgi:hypothetical protein